MKLSIIIPVYNEIATIQKILDDINQVNLLNHEKEIIVVDDGSSDGTKEFLSKLSFPGIKTLFHSQNSGKTAAIKTGLTKATGEIVIIQDADLEYLPSKNYFNLLEPLFQGYADAVYGSRFIGTHRVFYFWHYLANKFLTNLTNILFDTMLTDMETGAKAFRRDLLNKINFTSRGFCFEPEVTAKIFKNKARVYETPITYCGRDYTQGKKIKPIDGLRAIAALIKYRFCD